MGRVLDNIKELLIILKCDNGVVIFLNELISEIQTDIFTNKMIYYLRFV